MAQGPSLSPFLKLQWKNAVLEDSVTLTSLGYCFVASGKSLDSPEPWFLHLQNEEYDTELS